MLEEAAARDAPHGRAEGVGEGEEQRLLFRSAEAGQGEVEKEDRERGDRGGGQHREEMPVTVEIDAGDARGQVDGHVQYAGEDGIVGDDVPADEPEPVGEVPLRELGEIEVSVRQQRDRQQLGRHRVAAPDVTEADVVNDEWQQQSDPRRDPRKRHGPAQNRPLLAQSRIQDSKSKIGTPL